jgi:branched-chain amino acid transport system substrate-binding protein
MIRVALAVALVAATALAPAAADPLKIGFIATMSSPTSRAGPDMLDAFKLGIKDSGGTLGGRQVDLIVGDDQLKPDVGLQVARQMIDSDKVQLITGLVLTNVTLAIAHAVVPQKIFMLSLNSGSSQLAGAGCSPYFFAASYQADTLSDAVAIYLDKKGVKSASIIAPNYAAGRDMLNGFKRDFKGRLASETYTPLDQFDFAAEIAEIGSAAPAATFFFYTSGAPSINFVKQYAEAGLKQKIPLYGVSYSLDEQTLPGMGDAAIGIEDSSIWTADLDNPANHVFVAHFTAAYHRLPSVFAAQAYDGARLLDAALKAVDGHIERADEFRHAMETAKFPTVRGHFRFNTNHFPIQDFQLAQVKRTKSGAIVNAYKEPIDKDHKDIFAPQCKMP